METTLPLAAMDRLMRKYGARRVSDSAKQALAEVFETIGAKITKKADVLSKHAGRKTIKSKDIEQASKEISVQ